jgi:hypothetical protein
VPRPTRTLLPWLLLLIPGVATAKEEGRVGILPVAGEPTLARKLDEELHRAVAARSGRGIVGPVGVQARLWRGEGVAEKVQSARAAVEEAEQKVLQMDRRGAVAAAQRAVSLLVGVGGRYHTPRLLSRAHLALARALLLRPTDANAARAALRVALEATPEGLEEQLPPRVAELLAEVRREPRRSREPTEGELSSLSQVAELPQLVWISTRARKGEVEVELLVYDRRGRAPDRPVRSRVASDQLVAQVAELVAASLPTPSASPVIEKPAAPPKPVQTPATPWYKKWWVWTLVGVVVIGGTTAGIVAATRDGSDGYTVRFQFE